MSPRPHVVVVLLNWHNSADTLACLDQLALSSYPSFTTVVVDNGSTDNSVAHIHKAYPDIVLIASSINHGFAGGVNLGIQYAAACGADYALLLNSDLEFVPDLIDHLVTSAEADPRAGLRGPKVYRTGSAAIYSMYGFRFRRWGLQLVGYHSEDTGQFDRLPIDAISGCAFLIARRTWESIGLLDSSFFFYCEDIDYCLRVADAGLTVAVVPAALVRHEPGGSTRTRTERRQFLLASGRVRLFRKHRARMRLAFLVLGELRETINQLRGALRARDLLAARGYLAGLIAGFQAPIVRMKE